MKAENKRPAFVSVNGFFVKFCLAGKAPDGGLAVDPTQSWRDLGYVEEGHAVVDGLKRRQWEATDVTGVKSFGKTKAQAVENMLDRLALYEVALDDATPSLFD